MNRSMIRFILGKVLWIEGLLILPVCLTGLIYRETVGLWYLAVAAGAVLLGLAMSRTKPASPVFYLKEGCVTTALSFPARSSSASFRWATLGFAVRQSILSR